VRELHISPSDLRVESTAESATMFSTVRIGYSLGATEVLVGTGRRRRHDEAGLSGFGHSAVAFPLTLSSPITAVLTATSPRRVGHDQSFP